jgi:hypothetical protein
MLMFRRELSLFHLFTFRFPGITAVMIAVGDGLMSNPALPGFVGFAGALIAGVALHFADQPVQSGFWLGAGAWGMLALVDLFFQDKMTPPTTIDIGYVVVELEEDDIDEDKKPNTGPHTSNATLALKLPGGGKMAFDAPFKIVAVAWCLWVWWQAPLSAYSWASWAGAWMVLGSASKCCLPWLPNTGD